jgi:hypothetical protein
MFSKIYIIGNIPDTPSVLVRKRFSEAKRKLEKFHVEVFNPVESFEDTISKEDAIKKNISGLLNSNAVYVLNNSNAIENNIEIMLALKLNKLILHEF